LLLLLLLPLAAASVCGPSPLCDKRNNQAAFKALGDCRPSDTAPGELLQA